MQPSIHQKTITIHTQQKPEKITNKLGYCFGEKTVKMALKRGSDALVAVQEVKRSRNELIAATNKDRALLEIVSIHDFIQFNLAANGSNLINNPFSG